MIHEIEHVAVEALIPYARNARTHSPAQVAQIAGSIREFGFINPVILDAADGIIAGHGRVMAAQQLGLATVPALRAAHLDDAQRRAYVLADNKLALNAGWDDELLRIELSDLDAEGFDLALTGFSDEEMAALLQDVEPPALLTDGEEAPEPPSNPVTVAGDVWLCGDHRVMCGDSTSADAVAVLMRGGLADMVFTDPPYGVSANGGRSDTVKSAGMTPIANDDLRGVDLAGFIVDALAVAPLANGGSFYVCYDQKTQHEFSGALRSVGWRQRSTIIWNKNVFGLSGFKGYRPKHELIAFGHTGDDYAWYGDNAQADVWDVPRPTERPGGHPTPKPVELIERALRNSSKPGFVVLDMFGGSGSTLVACERGGRSARLMELEPKYCDVIVRRWQEMTGRDAVLEATGETFNTKASE